MMTATIYTVVLALSFVLVWNENNASYTKNGRFTKYSILDPVFPVNIIVDTDAGADDAIAILNFLGESELTKNVGVVLITAVAGNTNADNVEMNVLKTLKTANRLDIPVYRGLNKSLLTQQELDNYFGMDGFGDFDFPNPPSRKLIKRGHAVNALVWAASHFPGLLTLVCIGPLTNIAMAVRMDPDFLTNLKEIFILGGSDSGVGNVKPGVEFNFYIDPEAAFIVLKEAEEKKVVLNLVTWETTLIRSSIPMNWRLYVLGNIDTPQVQLINKAERKTLKGSTWASADPIVSGVVIDDLLVEEEGTYHVDVEVCGTYGKASMFVDYTNITTAFKNVRLIKKINVTKYENMLLKNFNAKL